MKSTREELLAALRKIEGVKVLVVGDIILDRYIWGKVERISPEAPVPIVDVKKNEDRLGGAGNVVRNLRGLGAIVGLAGFIGDDEEGRIVLNLLDDGHTNRDGVIVDRSKRTALKTRVVAHPQQVCRIDREDKGPPPAALQEALAAVVDSQLDNYDAIIISDYAKGAVGEVLMKKILEARSNKRLGLGIRPLVIDPKPANFDLYKYATVIKPNRKEAEAAVGKPMRSIEQVFESAQGLQSRWNSEILLITLGEGGMALLSDSGKSKEHVETIAREVFDVSGAGDTVTAVITAALARNSSPILAAELSNVAAGMVVSEVGTVAIDQRRMIEGIHGIFTKGTES